MKIRTSFVLQATLLSITTKTNQGLSLLLLSPPTSSRSRTARHVRIAFYNTNTLLSSNSKHKYQSYQSTLTPQSFQFHSSSAFLYDDEPITRSNNFDYNTMPRGVKKENLPTKICVTCNRPFTWRKVWDEVTTCSKSCNRKRREKNASVRFMAKRQMMGERNDDKGDDDDEHTVIEESSVCCAREGIVTLMSSKSSTTSMRINDDDKCQGEGSSDPKKQDDLERDNEKKDAHEKNNMQETTSINMKEHKDDVDDDDEEEASFDDEASLSNLLRDLSILPSCDGEQPLSSINDNASDTTTIAATANVVNIDDIEDPVARRKAQRKAEKKRKKAERRAKREGRSDKSVGQKQCDVCSKSVDLLVRCTIDETSQWKMVCGKCWNVVSGGVVDGDVSHPYYRYGGLWKNRKRK